MNLSFPNYVLKALSQKRELDVIEDLETLSKQFNAAKINTNEAFKFIFDEEKFDTKNFALINLPDQDTINIFVKAKIHETDKQTTRFVTNTTNRDNDGILSQIVTSKERKTFFKSSKRVLNLSEFMKASSELELWNSIQAEETLDEGRLLHQIFPVPIGIIKSIFTEKDTGAITVSDLYSLSVHVLMLLKENEELKKSDYIRALISFLATPVHIQEKHHKSSSCYGYSTKPITGKEKNYHKTIQSFIEEVKATVDEIPVPSKPSATSEEDDAIVEEESEQINDDQEGDDDSQSQKEVHHQETSGLASTLQEEVPVDGKDARTPKKPKRTRKHQLDSDSEDESEGSISEESDSDDSESDDDSKKRKKKKPKVSKSSSAKVPQAAPQCTQNTTVTQYPVYDVKNLFQAVESSKNLFNRLSDLNCNMIRLRNKTETKRPKNFSPALQAILEQCRKKEDIPGELRAAIREKCRSLNICYNLEPLDTKFCERLVSPAQSHEETMVDKVNEIRGYSLTGFIGRGTKSITSNGQKIGIPASTNQLLDMVGHTWVYMNIERRKALLTKRYGELYIGLKQNEHQLRCYFDRGDETFGAHLVKLIHNFTTHFLTGCYDGRTWGASSLNFQGEIIEKITLNTYPHISRKKGDTTGDRRGGQPGGGRGNGGGDAPNQPGNANKNKKRGTGKGPFTYTGPRGHIHKYLGREALATMGDSIPKDGEGKRLCFNALTYEKCTFPGCKFSHKIAENMNGIEAWISTNNLPFKKRE